MLLLTHTPAHESPILAQMVNPELALQAHAAQRPGRAHNGFNDREPSEHQADDVWPALLESAWWRE